MNANANANKNANAIFGSLPSSFAILGCSNLTVLVFAFAFASSGEPT